MAAVGVTLLDLKEEVWIWLYGQKFATDQVGSAKIKQHVNRAYLEVIAELGKLAYAGSLYQTASYATNGTYIRFPYGAASGASGEVCAGQLLVVLVPAAVEVLATSWLDMHYGEPEKILGVFRGALGGKYHYTFQGSEIWVRPAPPAGTLTFHYIQAPEALSGDSDSLACSRQLFRAIALRAALLAAPAVASMPPDRIANLMTAYEGEMTKLSGHVMEAKAREMEGRTGKDLTFGGQAPGQGG